jgi:hypothetical protein
LASSDEYPEFGRKHSCSTEAADVVAALVEVVAVTVVVFGMVGDGVALVGAPVGDAVSDSVGDNVGSTVGL